MREFTDKEKALISKIVALRRENRGKVLSEYQTSKLLIESSSFFAVRWNKQELYLYSRERHTEENALDIYFELSDYLYFLEELKDNHLIQIQSFIDNGEKPYKMMVDPEKYIYDENTDSFLQKESSDYFNQFKDGPQTDLINLLDTYVYLKYIYPLPALIDYEEDFKMPEQRNFEKQMKNAEEKHAEEMKNAKSVLCWTRAAFLVAFISTLITILMTLSDKFCE